MIKRIVNQVIFLGIWNRPIRKNRKNDKIITITSYYGIFVKAKEASLRLKYIN